MRRRFNGQERAVLYLAQDGLCAECGTELEPSWHADHMKAWSHGGPTDVTNGQALCPTCNLKKGNKESMKIKFPLRDWQRDALDMYDQYQGKFFLAESFPATGKTRFIAEVVQREMHKEKADAIVVVVPQKDLRKQMADDFHDETGIQIDPKWNGDGVSLIHGQFKGVVITYQWIASGLNAKLLRRYISRQATLVVLDEVHHAQDEKPWGDKLREALEPATRILLTTGTPFTTNGNPIYGVNYDPDTGLAIANYSYNCGRAITDGVIRVPIFNRCQGEMVWDSEDGKVRATFEVKLNKRDMGRRLRTAIHEDKEHVGSLLREAYAKLRELREDDPDAAMLVVAKDQPHAKNLAKRMKQEMGITPIVAISEDGDIASGAIAAFKKSDEPCIIAVNMVSEGVNIPRIRVIVYATNVTTYLYFVQVLGRALRIEPNHDDHTAWIFIPDDERFREFADKIMRECEEALKKDISRPKPEDKKQPENTLWFNPLSASFDDVAATFNGVHIESRELDIAATVRSANPTFFKGGGFSREHIAMTLKAVGFDFSSARQNPDSPNGNQPEAEKPLHVRLAELKASNKKIVGSLHYKLKIDFMDIQNRLNASVGIRSVTKCFDPDKLELRLELAKRWFLQDIIPEAPFDDKSAS